MTNTPRLALPAIEAAQAQKHVTHNEALTLLDALTQLAVESRTLTTLPDAGRWRLLYPGRGRNLRMGGLERTDRAL